MKTTYITNFLDSIYEDKKSFAEVYGTEKLFDPRFMLIADTVLESKELLSDVILEALQESQERYLQHNSCSSITISAKN